MLKLGFRCVGKTQGWGGQYATTRFLHVCWMPIIPVAGVWIVSEEGARSVAWWERIVSPGCGRQSHPMRLSLRSVVAGYATMWIPFLAVFGIGISPVFWRIGLPIAIVSAAMIAWMWRARTLRSERARRRSDLNVVALGTRCDPMAMRLRMAKEVRRGAEAAWAQVSHGRSPDDVAARGASSELQMVWAHAVLRVAARTAAGRAAASARRASDQILDRHREVDAVGGPYRRSDASSRIHRGQPG